MKGLAAALVEAQKEMPTVKKNAMNPHFGKPFVSLDHLIAQTKPTLTKHGLVIAQNPHVVDGVHVLRTSLIHAESGEMLHADTPLLLNGKNDMQALGSAITYARRYAWASVLGVCDEADDDGNFASAPGTGAHKDSSATSITGSAAGSGAATSGGSMAAPHPSNDDNWTHTFGKHKGKTVAQVEEEDPGWHDWFLENGKKEDVKARINEHRTLSALATDVPGGSFYSADSDADIPFDRTVDGLGN